LEAGFTVTLVGMGVVFVLLTLLVGVIQSMSYLSRLIDGGMKPAPAGSAQAPVMDEEIVGVISAAIRMYRRRQGYPE
jgi:sodium pump decarboxylase gamma subunit